VREQKFKLTFLQKFLMITTFLLQLFIDLDRYIGYASREYICFFFPHALILSFIDQMIKLRTLRHEKYLCSDNNSNSNRVKKIQHDAQLTLSIFRQPLHVLGISRPIIKRYNHIYTTVGTYYSF
jgi:hypothetical protein